jgi:hypothetical protein
MDEKAFTHMIFLGKHLGFIAKMFLFIGLGCQLLGQAFLQTTGVQKNYLGLWGVGH